MSSIAIINTTPSVGNLYRLVSFDFSSTHQKPLSDEEFQSERDVTRERMLSWHRRHSGARNRCGRMRRLQERGCNVQKCRMIDMLPHCHQPTLQLFTAVIRSVVRAKFVERSRANLFASVLPRTRAWMVNVLVRVFRFICR